MATVGVFGSTGADPAHEGYFAPLMSGFFKSALAFNYVRDRSIFYGPPMPLLHWLSGVGFAFGTVQAVRRWREPGPGLMLIWLIGTVIFGGALMNDPPESPRLLIAAPAVAILVAIGFYDLATQITRFARPTSRRGGQVLSSIFYGRRLAIAVAFVATCISLVYYLGIYTPSRQFGDIKTHIAHHLGIWARSLEPSHQVYFFGAPLMTYAGFPSIEFLAPQVNIQDVIDPIETPLPIKGDTTFVFVPQRLDELDIIAAAHPEGQRWTVLDSKGHLLFVAYEVFSEQTQTSTRP
jgi:hypothetical protein